jgi:hypothetical protein
MEQVGRVVLALGLNYGVHYGSIWIHSALCVPHSFSELLSGIVMTASPVCSMTLKVAQHTQNSYAAIVTTTMTNGLVDLLKNAF